MTDDGICILLILVKEIVCARKGDLVDVFVDFLFCHTNTTVGDSKCACILIDTYMHSQIPSFFFQLTFRSKCAKFLSGIYCIGNNFTEENFMV